MKKQTLYLETTEVEAERSAAEISSVLIQAGASQIATDYDQGRIVGLRWCMRVSGQDLMYAMPARVEPIYKILRKRRGGNYISDKDEAALRAKATRVAWRQLLLWTKAQLAMIQCGMAEAPEVFFPYYQTPMGESIYALFKGQQFKMLPPPERQ